MNMKDRIQELLNRTWHFEYQAQRDFVTDLVSILGVLAHKVESLEPESLTEDDLKDASWNAKLNDYSSEIQSSIKDSGYIDKRLEESMEERSKGLIEGWDREDESRRERDKLSKGLVDRVLSDPFAGNSTIQLAQQLKVKFDAIKE